MIELFGLTWLCNVFIPDDEVVRQVKPSVYAGFKPFQEPQVHHFVHHFRNLR